MRVVVVLGPVENDRRALPGIGIAGSLQILAAEILADDRCLEQARIKQVAVQHHKAGLLLERLLIGLDHPLIQYSSVGQIFAHGLAGYGQSIAIQLAGLEQFSHDRRHAAGAIKAFAQVFAGRLAVDQQRNLVAKGLPILDGQFQPDVAGNGRDMDRRVGRATQRRVGDDGVAEGILGQNLGGGQVFQHHLDDALAGLVGHLLAFAIGRGDGGAAGQRQTQRFGQ